MPKKPKYRVATECLKCGLKWVTRAKKSQKPAQRCKNCKSPRTMIDPDRERAVIPVFE